MIYDSLMTFPGPALTPGNNPRGGISEHFCHTFVTLCFYSRGFLTGDIAMSTHTTFQTARRLVLVLTATAWLGACATVQKPLSIADTIANTPSLSTLSGLVKSAGLTETLQGTGPFTVFAPSNDAFKAVPAATLEDLNKHPEKLKNLLSFHAVSGALLAKDVKNSNVKALNGDALALSKAGEFVTVENAAVTQADLVATNGVIHIVDVVMTPPKK
jgi:uncharacterized surface protein with fasciclin (FAS1) repeats